MKPTPSDEFTRFENALGQVLKTSKSDLIRMLAEEKIANEGRPKPGPKPGSKPRQSSSVSVSGRVSRDKG
jgi:hypothetical protein